MVKSFSDKNLETSFWNCLMRVTAKGTLTPCSFKVSVIPSNSTMLEVPENGLLEIDKVLSLNVSEEESRGKDANESNFGADILLKDGEEVVSPNIVKSVSFDIEFVWKIQPMRL
jgi:hypothetical protein